MRMLSLALVMLLTAAAGAWAADNESGGHPGMAEHNSIGLGFHTGTLADVGDVTIHGAPIGMRWWLPGQRIGIDAGFGLGSSDVPGTDESLSHWAIDIGVPFVLKSWNKVHFLARPGVNFGSEDIEVDTAPFAKDQLTLFGFTAELETEVFLADNVTVSASHGIGYLSANPPGPGDNITQWGTLGREFTQVGFHVYLWGPYTTSMTSH